MGLSLPTRMATAASLATISAPDGLLPSLANFSAERLPECGGTLQQSCHTALHGQNKHMDVCLVAGVDRSCSAMLCRGLRASRSSSPRSYPAR